MLVWLRDGASMEIEDNFVIFRNYSTRGYWEVSGYMYTTYLTHEVLKEQDKERVELMLALHGLEDIPSIIETLIKYTQDPQEDMFIVEIK